ncbi:toprim domain-containing protein [Hyphomicrobium sp. DY-1]|uniref:DUF7146 domain-containing protein n=1 Tax=Hyphomicrobium sp. DY-1 TaxID=3075650 RepID=UPI0039C3DAD6
MTQAFRQLSERLSAHAEAVCAYYLSNGKKNGRYWIVGNVQNAPGQSMWVRLVGPSYGHGAAGKWTDAATGEHGDLIDLIALNRNLATHDDIRDEVLSFLSEPRHITRPATTPAPRNSPEAARRLFKASAPLRGTPAETYLRNRSITTALDFPSLRFHPGCYYRGNDNATLQKLPALIAGVTSLAGDITGLLRIYLSEDGTTKAAVTEPKLSMGNILGNAVRFGLADDVMAAGEGVETMLALKSLLPKMPMAAASSAAHLGAMELPRSLQRLYIAMEAGRAGRSATERLIFTAAAQGIEVFILASRLDDWNSDLRADGTHMTRDRLHPQLAEQDRQKVSHAVSGRPPRSAKPNCPRAP